MGVVTRTHAYFKMAVRLKRKYLRKARIVQRRRERESASASISYTVPTPSTCTPNDSTLTNESQEISIHIETNKELKRLLLASVGSDLEHQIDNLVTDKTKLQGELDRSVSRLQTVTEEADHLLIECDIWRSKFLASRVMIEELMRSKSATSSNYTECIKSLNVLLNERQLLRNHVASCNAMLKRCLLQLNKADGLFINKGSGNNVLDVASVNTKAVRQLLDTIMVTEDPHGDRKTEDYGNGNTSFDKSYGETLAQEALIASKVSVPISVDPRHAPSLPHLSVGEQHLLQRTVASKESRYTTSLIPAIIESFTLHYCRNCRGKVMNV